MKNNGNKILLVLALLTGICLIYYCQTRITQKSSNTPISSTTQKSNKQNQTKENSKDNASQESKKDLSKANKNALVYDLKKANKKYKLADKLREISGLTYIGNNELACVQDEKGEVFIYNLQTKKITDKIHFGKNGDYEGIALVDEQMWVVQSNGNLIRIKHLADDNQKEKKIGTFLKTKNDVEGLCWDKINNRLLLACKGLPSPNAQELKGQKAVYAFNLADKTLAETPAFTISLDLIQEKMETSGLVKAAEKVSDFLNPEGGNITFNPSAIEIHPITKEIYIIATSGKLMVVLDEDGQEILHIERLSPKVFKQPEGITFDEQGTMYISNEGKGGKANILRFDKR